VTSHNTRSLSYTVVETSKLACHQFRTIQLPARDGILLQDTKTLSTKPYHMDHIMRKSIQSKLHPDIKRVKGPILSSSWKPQFSLCKMGQGLLVIVDLYMALSKSTTFIFCPSLP
jgi:hypothetical protein